MYKVIAYFTDLTDGEHAYNAGDTFPREGLTVSPERIAKLASANNRRGIPLIAEVENEKTEEAEAAETEEAAETGNMQITEKKRGRPKKAEKDA